MVTVILMKKMMQMIPGRLVDSSSSFLGEFVSSSLNFGGVIWILKLRSCLIYDDLDGHGSHGSHGSVICLVMENSL